MWLYFLLCIENVFFSKARRHAAKTIAIGSTIPFAAAKDDMDYDYNIEDFKDDFDDVLPRKRNSQSTNDDDEEYRPENERPRKELKQTKLTRGQGPRALAPATRKSARHSRQSLRPDNSVIEIESSSDEESIREPKPLLSQDPVHVDLVPLKISIGRNVFHHAQVELHVDPRHEDRCQLVLSYKNETRRLSRSRTLRSTSLSSEKSEDRSHVIALGADLREVKFYFSNQQMDEIGGSERFKDSFLAMNVKSNHDNGLAVYSKSYKPDSDNDMLRNIVVAFSSVTDLDHAILAIKRNLSLSFYVTEASRINVTAASGYCRAILEDDAMERHDAIAQFIAGKETEEIMLLYPFGDSALSIAMDEAASGLGELSCVLNRENMVGDTSSSTNGSVEPKVENDDMDPENGDGLGEESKAVLAFSVSTIERLGPGVYLNDTLIDFWLQWIWRNCEKSNIHYFTTLFFTTLEKKGAVGVSRWTEKRGVDIFTKKFIFIPINKNQHWSLCVVVNPGAIVERLNVMRDDVKNVNNVSNEDDPYPCLLFFDSLKTHAKARFAKLVRTWLNSEWHRLQPNHVLNDPFTADSMRLCSPDIPYQMNSWDCGVYVCRYAYAMYLLRKSRFTYSEVEYSEGIPSFRKLITEHDAFRFDADDIRRIREEYLSLVGRLSELYRKWKEDNDRKRIEARRAKKEEVKSDRPNLLVRKEPCDGEGCFEIL
jgi:Ulp1 protease family, C-terminal catalytic domain